MGWNSLVLVRVVDIDVSGSRVLGFYIGILINIKWIGELRKYVFINDKIIIYIIYYLFYMRLYNF